MEIKHYIKKIISSTDDKKKDELAHWMCEILEHMDSDLEEVERELYEMSEGKVLNEEKAGKLIEDMKPFGMK